MKIAIALLMTVLASNVSAMLLDFEGRTELPISSMVAFHEIQVETHTFETTQPNEVVTIAVSIPYTIYTTITADTNGAFRVYLDGSKYLYVNNAAQWDGEILINGGGWSSRAGVPFSAQIGGTVRKTITTPGTHTIRIMYSGSTTYTIGILRTLRRVQVWN